jgi:hypothetical protein
MNHFAKIVLGGCVAAGVVCAATAQDKPALPQVLQITREYVKPGRQGLAHERAESAFVNAMKKAKWPTHYLAMTSLSGKPRVLFLTSYASFDAWQKDADATAKNGALSAALDKAAIADGDILDTEDQAVLYFQEEQSLKPRADLSQFRYMEVSVYHVRPGKTKDWEEAVKLVKAGYEKGVPDAHWGMFQVTYGADGGEYVVLTGHKDLAEIDKGFADGKQFGAAMGEEGMKKLEELVASCIESSSHQLFAFNPEMSYVSDEWVKQDPAFWGPKPMEKAAKAPAEEKKANP